MTQNTFLERVEALPLGTLSALHVGNVRIELGAESGGVGAELVFAAGTPCKVVLADAEDTDPMEETANTPAHALALALDHMARFGEIWKGTFSFTLGSARMTVKAWRENECLEGDTFRPAGTGYRMSLELAESNCFETDELATRLDDLRELTASTTGLPALLALIFGKKE